MTEPRRTFCRICEAHCGLLVDMDEDGSIVKLRPDDSHPVSHGFVCAKGLRFLNIADHPDRILYPLIRNADGELVRASWDAALSLVSHRIRPILAKYGPHSVALYFGTPFIHNALGMIALTRLVNAIGTRNVYSAGSQDNNNKLAAQRLIHGSDFMQPIMDLGRADLAVILGANPALSQGTFIHLRGGTKFYDDFIKRGGQMVIIDPRKSESAQRWGGHIPIRPTTDIYLLLALLNELSDLAAPPYPDGLLQVLELASRYPVSRASSLTGILEDTIRELAHKIRSTPRVTFHMSVGVNQGRFGTLSMIAMQAIAYLTGNFDREGGILFQPYARLLEPLTGSKPQRSRIGNYLSNVGGMPCGILGDEIMTHGDGQIRALIVVSGNPLTSAPDEHKLRRAFDQLDLVVCIDLFRNQTSQYAHVVLPGTTWLERADLSGWDAMHELEPMLQISPRIRPAPGETRTESAALAELALAAGRPFLGSRWLTLIWAQADLDRFSATLLGIIAKVFRKQVKGADAIPWPVPKGGYYRRRRGKYPRFWDSSLDGEPERLEAYANTVQREADGDTFLLIGRRRRLGQNSWIHNAGREIEARESVAWLHPDDMKRLALNEDEVVEIRSLVASIMIPARGMDTIMPGTIAVPHGLPEINVNSLISSAPEHIDPVSGMHQMVGHRVQVCRIAV